MIREISQFVRTAPELLKLQKTMPQAQFFDCMTARADAQGWAEIRRELVRGLRGRVLEVGCGTGAMFACYDATTEVDAIEPVDEFLALAVEKAEDYGGRIRAVKGDGMNLAYPDASFDAVVFGLVLCSVPSVERVVSEAVRVLKPGGELRALEHVRSERRASGIMMDAFNPVWLALNKQGCNMNRLPIPKLEAAGLRIDDVNAFQRFDTLMPAFLMQRIRAHKPV